MVNVNLEVFTKGSNVPMINTITLIAGGREMVIDRRETDYDAVDEDKWTHTWITFRDCYEWDGDNEKPVDIDALVDAPDDVRIVDIDIEDDAPDDYEVIPLRTSLEDDTYSIDIDVDYDALDARGYRY